MDAYKSAFSHSSHCIAASSPPASIAFSNAGAGLIDSHGAAMIDDIEDAVSADKYPGNNADEAGFPVSPTTDNVWDKCFDDIWEDALTAADELNAIAWVKNRLKYIVNSPVFRAQSNPRMGVKCSASCNNASTNSVNWLKSMRKTYHSIKHLLLTTTALHPMIWLRITNCTMSAHVAYSRYSGVRLVQDLTPS